MPVYYVACRVAEVGHKIARKPYEDPEDIVFDIVTNTFIYAKNSIHNWWKTTQAARNPRGSGNRRPSGQRRDPPPVPPCFTHTM